VSIYRERERDGFIMRKRNKMKSVENNVNDSGKSPLIARSSVSGVDSVLVASFEYLVTVDALLY
jgi:hypothetical protein